MAGGRRGGIRGEVLASGIMRALQSRLAQLVVLLTLTHGAFIVDIVRQRFYIVAHLLHVTAYGLLLVCCLAFIGVMLAWRI
jgi:hypothetical protein